MTEYIGTGEIENNRQIFKELMMQKENKENTFLHDGRKNYVFFSIKLYNLCLKKVLVILVYV